MTDIPRRDFLRNTAVGVAGVSKLAGWHKHGATPSIETDHIIPPHEAMPIPGLHSYAEESILAGETIHFRTSSTTPYELSIVKLGPEIDDFTSDETLYVFPKNSPQQQPIHPGSYIHIAKGIDSNEEFSGLTIECWIRPWSWERDQALISTFDPMGDCGFALYLTRGGWIKFYLGNGGSFVEKRWRLAYKRNEIRRWHHLALTWENGRATFYSDGKFQGSWDDLPGPLKTGGSALRLAASGRNGKAVDFFDGDLAAPAIYARALSAQEIQNRRAARGLKPPKADKLLAYWPLSEEIGDTVMDASDAGHHGRIINRATWMIGGPSFDAKSIDRWEEYDPVNDTTRGHALRFASDDLFDCRWQVTEKYTIPKNAESGLYVGRFKFEDQGEPRHYHVTFIVRKAADQGKKSVLMLCSTNTWRAYSATPFAANTADRQLWDTPGLPNAVAEAPSYSCYRNHHQGQPSYSFGRQMPWPCAGPDVLFSEPDVNYSHLMRGERFAHQWFKKNGFFYDMIGDYDLHANPDQLNGYDVLVINGHSEYWSNQAYDAVDDFLAKGGNVIVMSGNTMFWRVSYDDDGAVMECRKFDTDIGGREAVAPGEIYHSHDGKRGSLLRYSSRPAWKVLGLECIGWWPITEENFAPYEAVETDHFLFREPEPVNLKPGERFGQSADGELPRVGGHESDVRVNWIKKITKHIPTGQTLPDEPEGITTLARIKASGRRGIDYFGRWEPLDHGVYAEMTYWQRPQGGRVFHTGCIAGGWALSVDPKLQTLMKNVLHHFGVKKDNRNEIIL